MATKNELPSYAKNFRTVKGVVGKVKICSMEHANKTKFYRRNNPDFDMKKSRLNSGFSFCRCFNIAKKNMVMESDLN